MIAFRDSTSPPAVPVGKIKSFGKLGPRYEIGPVSRKTDEGGWLIHIKIVETGEEMEYLYNRLREDPDAR
jgi:hypothetical protein